MEGLSDESFVVEKILKKQENGVTLYSQPIEGEEYRWKMLKISYEEGHYSNADKVRLNINLNNVDQSFNLNPETTKLEWGLLDSKKAVNMTINGDSPTEVIPITLDGDNVYFWYYEDLQLGDLENVEIKFEK